MSDEYVKVPRVTIEVTEETFNKFANYVPWGLRSKVLSLILDDLLDLIEHEGDIVITALVSRAIRGTTIIKEIPRGGGKN